MNQIGKIASGLGGEDKLYYAFSGLIAKLKRDLTVLVYDMEGLKRVPSWQMVDMIKDGRFVLDRAGVRK